MKANAPAPAALFCALAALIGAGGSAKAAPPGGQAMQSKAAPSEGESSRRSQALLPDRDRAAIHPGDPLKLIGLEQGQNDLRSRTPALARSDRVSAKVDEDQNHQRALAMYGEGATFQEPVMTPASARTIGHSAAVGATPSTDSASSSGPGEWPWAIGIGASALVLLWIQKRFGLPFLERGSGRA